MKRLLLSSIAPLGWVNVVALLFAPLALASLARDRVPSDALWTWVVAIWFAAAAQAAVLVLRRRWWLRFTSWVATGRYDAQVRSGELSEALRIQATTDALTGLSNRAAVVDDLRRRLDDGETPTVMFIDLERFKDINDGHGHDVGDEVCG